MTGTRRIVGVVVPVVLTVLLAVAVTARAGWPQVPSPERVGEGESRDTGMSRQASHEGLYWQALSGKEKNAYVRTYLADVLTRQVREIAAAAHRSADGSEVPTRVRDTIVDSLRASHAVRFPFAATVYVAQLDDFYWWQDHMAVAVDDALQRINAQMEAQQAKP